MRNKISFTNESFDFLGNSSEFLNLMIHDIGSCILLLDKDMMLYAYNEPLKNIFADKPNEDILYKKCGNVIGCAYAVEEEKECGTSSQCAFCSLRENTFNSYLDNQAIYNIRIDREFYKTNTEKVLKHLQFSTRLFNFKKDKYIMIIIEDITQLIDQQEEICKQRTLIDSFHYSEG
jgi:hypothetical protein